MYLSANDLPLPRNSGESTVPGKSQLDSLVHQQEMWIIYALATIILFVVIVIVVIRLVIQSNKKSSQVGNPPTENQEPLQN